MGKLYVLMGPSGSGKTTIGREVEKILNLKFLTTLTTRQPRPGEVDSRDYDFISRELFLRLRAEGKLAEDIEHAGNFYGTTKESLVRLSQTNNNYWVALTKDAYEDYVQYVSKDNMVVIYIMVDEEIIMERMKKRGSTPEEIQKRLACYDDDLKGIEYADFIIGNEGPLQDAVRAVVNAITIYGLPKGA